MYGNTTVDCNHTDQTLCCVVWLRLVRVCLSLVLLPSPTLKPIAREEQTTQVNMY